MNITMREWIAIPIVMSAGIEYIAIAEESDSAIAHEQIINYESSSYQTALLELYTSEDCNSCPPADRWLSSLQNEPSLWKEFIPIALHIDYWDYIGRKDRFASPAYPCVSTWSKTPFKNTQYPVYTGTRTGETHPPKILQRT